MPTFSPRLSAMNVGDPGEGLCVFFYDSRFNFGPGGSGSALGYTNYKGEPGFRNEGELTEFNGMQGAMLGVGLDVRGEFSTSNNKKAGNYNTANYCGVSGQGVASPNTICTRSGTVSSYRILNTTPNLSTFPTPISLHEYVADVDDITFKSVRVWLRNECRQLRVEIKDPITEKYIPYQTVDLDDLGPSSYVYNHKLSGFGGIPPVLKVGLGFSTSDSFSNCVLKNIAVYGDTITHTVHASLSTSKVYPDQGKVVIGDDPTVC